MSSIKSQQDISSLKEGGKIIGRILNAAIAMAKPGVTTKQIDEFVEAEITKAGGRPSFKNYKPSPSEEPFASSICASVNDEVVHTPASEYVLKEGDILTVDVGMEYKGMYTDTAKTTGVGVISQEDQALLDVTQKSLEAGIKAVKAGAAVADISKAVENYVNSQGKYGVIRSLVGHGVGYDVHEPPHIPNYYSPSHKHVELKAGMVIAIEPMITRGSHEIETLDDGWTIVTSDGSNAAHFEHTVVVTEAGVEIITQE